MLHPPRSVLLLVTSLIFLAPLGVAHADHFKFIVIFTNGSLSGSYYVGYFTTDKPAGDFTPNAGTGEQLISLAITIDAAKFIMQDDTDFPLYPRVRIQSSGNPVSFDFIARSATALHDKYVWMFLRNVENEVRFGTRRGAKEFVESTGVIYDIVPINAKEAPPEPQCLPCHSEMRR